MGDLAQKAFIDHDPEAVGEAAGMFAMPHLFKMPDLPNSLRGVPGFLRQPVEFRYGKSAGGGMSSKPPPGRVNKQQTSRGASAKAGAPSALRASGQFSPADPTATVDMWG